MSYNPQGYINNKVVEFFPKAIHMTFKSKEGGKAIYEDKDYIRIQVIGQSTTVIERKVKESDKLEYRPHWEAYLEGKEVVTEGLIIENWSYLTPAQVKTLRSLKVRTVEQLAELGDHNLKNIGFDGRDLRKKAKEFINVHGIKNARIGELEKKIEELTKIIKGNKDESTNDMSKRGKRSGSVRAAS